MNVTRYNQGGSILIIAIMAMLILGILSFSFALLSRLQVTTGVNYKAQAQAEALAEAGFERGRDACAPPPTPVRGAVSRNGRIPAARPRMLRRGARQAAVQWDQPRGGELLGGHRQ